jgi:two-component system, OmpR family, phosphate regulon sensor histidine kinase PhoR
MSRLPPSQSLIDALDEPALIVEQGRTIAANKAARDLLGGDIVGRDVRLALRQPAALEAIETGAQADLTLTGVGGMERPWALIIRPITERTLLLRLIDRSAMVAAEKMRVDFVANASHELRTPLATIAGYAETLAEEEPVGDGIRRKFAATIRTEAARMLRIIEDLMDLSRIEAGRFALPRARVDLGAIARQAAVQIEPLAERRQCRIKIDIAEHLAAIRGDEAQLIQVVDNLLSNALRYGCRGKSDQVTLSVNMDGGRVLLTVADRGEGVPAIHLPRLTERFYRVDNARSRNTGGTGLGLAIVKHILERHRATMTITSAVGRGTTVTASFPAALS